MKKVDVGFVNSILHNLPIKDEPAFAHELMLNKFFDTAKRKRILRKKGEITINYTIKPDGTVLETPMQKGIDKGVKNLIVMDDHEHKHFAERHAYVIIKDSAKQTADWISKLQPEIQNALKQHGNMYVSKMYYAEGGKEHNQYNTAAFSKEVA